MSIPIPSGSSFIANLEENFNQMRVKNCVYLLTSAMAKSFCGYELCGTVCRYLVIYLGRSFSRINNCRLVFSESAENFHIITKFYGEAYSTLFFTSL